MMEQQNIVLNEAVAPGLEPFVASFFEDRKKEFSQLKLFIQDSNFEGALKVAHNWKGYCEPYGFGRLGVLAAQLEKAIAQNETKSITTLLFSMDEYFAHRKMSVV